MSIEREMIRDIDSYEPKFMGPFKLRELICLVLGGVVSVSIYFLLRTVFIDVFSLIVGAIFGVPIFFCGFKKPYGIPMEKFLVIVISNMFNKKRPYYKINAYEVEYNMHRLPDFTEKELKEYKKMTKNVKGRLE